MVFVNVLHGVSVSIMSGGTALQEFADSSLDGDHRTIARYVQCTMDTQFEISVEAMPHTPFQGDALVFSVYVDGQYTQGVYLKKRRVRSGVARELLKGRSVSSTKILPYRFRALKLVEGQPALADAAMVKKLGCISVKVEHGKLGVLAPRRFGSFEETKAISEKSLKGQAVSCSAGFGEPISQRTGSDAQTWTPVGSAPTIVNLHYRSRQDLKAMHIIPRSPSPLPIEQRSYADLTQDDVRRLQEELQVLRETQREAKPLLKREADSEAAQSRKRARPDGGRVVMILDDDDDTFREVVQPAGTTTTSNTLDTLDLTV